MSKRISFLTIISVVLFSTSVFATTPVSIQASYDSAKSELSVIVEHPITKTKEHFINKIVISKDGKELVTKSFNFQTSHRNQTMVPIKLSLLSGDVINIVAYCNQGQFKEEVVTIK